MSEEHQKGKTLENGCHDRRLGLCAVYLRVFLTAGSSSALTPCQPHLAGGLWAAGSAAEVEVHKAGGLNGTDWAGLSWSQASRRRQ